MSENVKKTIITHQPFFQTDFVRANADLVIGGSAMGVGKLHPLNSLILTPCGWVEMREIKVGSTIITPFDGEARVTHVFPQGVKDIYEVRTDDGRVSECGLEHLWTIRTKSQLEKHRANPDKWDYVKTVDTKFLIGMIKDGITINLPINKAIQFTDKEYIIPPYLMGVLIGDGCLTDTILKGGSGSFKVSNSEEDILNKIYAMSDSTKRSDHKGCYTKSFFTPHINEYRKYLIENNLNTYSYNKFIPNEYLLGSIEQRRELLYGLMDTDGTVGDKNRYRYTTTSEKLADNFIELCRGLGYIAIKHRENRSRSHKYTNGECFYINIITDEIIFSSKKHLDKYNYNSEHSSRKYARTYDHVRIISINKKREDEAQCIVIDNDKHLYICDDYTTTHNSFAALLMAAEPSLDPNFRMVCIRKTLNDTKVGGSLTDDALMIYGNMATLKISENPRLSFSNGAFIDFTHMNDETPDKVLERVKGWQYDCIFWDEGTGYQWNTFKTVLSRNRGKAAWSGKCRIATNPKKSHWLRIFCDWWINPVSGLPIPERNGVIRYFYMKGEKVTDVVWSDTKEGVYNECRYQIDPIIKKMNEDGDNYSYNELIKSCTFLSGKLSGNKELLKNNPGYMASVAAMGEKSSAANLLGSWNIDMSDDSEAPISQVNANEVFMNDSQRNNDKWITVDLADEGTDNMLALVWDGFHVYDKMILSKSTPRENAERTKLLAETHGIGDDHIIFDATAARYFLDYIPDAMPYLSRRSPIGLYGRMAMQLKDECYLRLVNMISHGRISVSENVGQARYFHQNLKQEITFQTEFVEECSVVRFKDVGSGRKRLVNKKEMNAMLGKGRSMDILDAFAMRMLPVAEFEYGTELEKTYVLDKSDEDDEDKLGNKLSIYDSSTWA